jgi:4-amino-4-deoxy-L-arabinose transferase-like glycosyltransferase
LSYTSRTLDCLGDTASLLQGGHGKNVYHGCSFKALQGIERPGRYVNVKYAQLLFLLFFGLAVFVPAIGTHDLWPADEPRYAQVAREMLETGDAITLRINEQPYLEKPPLLFWAIAAVSKPFGDVSALTARIPSVVSALVAVAFTYLLAARLYSPRVGFWSALILITANRFWTQATHAQIDMLLTAFMSGGLYAFWRWHKTPRPGWLLLFYGCSAAGVYAKGPVGVIFPLLLIFSFYWKRPEARKRTHWALGILAIAVLIALWLIPARLAASREAQTIATETVATDLFRQTIGRFILGVSKAQWPWYYLETLPADWLPWSLFLPWTLPYVWKRRREGEEMRFLLCWILPAFVFFSACVGKRALYLLPLFPAMAILIARSVLDLMEGDHAVWRRRTGLVWAAVLLLLAAAPFALRFSPYPDAWSAELLAFSACAAVFAAVTLYHVVRTDMRQLHALMASHFAGLVILVALVALPQLNEFKSARPFCEPIRTLAETGESFHLYSVGFSREEYVYYAHHPHTPVLIELLDLETAQPLAPREMVRLQKRMKKIIADAVEDVPADVMDSVSEAELQALETAMHDAADDEVAPGLLEQFRDKLVRETNVFFEVFESDAPAFLFVMENDWRWILAIHPSACAYPIIRSEQVGSRYVLLIANKAGAASLEKHGIDIQIKRPGAA